MVVPVVLYHVSTMAEPIDRPPLPVPWEQHPPKAPAQPRLPPHQDEEADPVLPISAKMASQNGAPSSFFSFLRCEVEIPQRCGVEIPPRVRLSLSQVMAPPHLQGDPCQLTSRAFSRPKWRGCSPSKLRGFFPANYRHSGGICSPFLTFIFLSANAPTSFRPRFSSAQIGRHGSKR